jgi:uncharacterized protein
MDNMVTINSPFIEETKIYIDSIPVIRLKPKIELQKFPTIILYHGWSSSKEFQRMRGYILSNLGFQVLIPDSVNHGERNPVDYTDLSNMKDFFWITVLQSIEESEKIINYAIDNLNMDKARIGVTGHSMGGFISTGIFTHNRKIKTGVILNGSANWNHCNKLLVENFMDNIDNPEVLKEEVLKIESNISTLDPINHLDKIKDRPLLMINGGADNVVPMESQKLFYEEARKSYSDKSIIDLIVYNNLGHFVTTNMMEDTSIWFKKFL